MLENLVIGWETIEPVFLVNIALNRPFILLGRHGTCKTTCAKEIAKIYGKKSFRFYDATKDDLISIAGIPIPQRLAKGKLEFSKHDRSIWNAKVIVIDELTRANRENQNLWLEILEEKTCFGRKLYYEALIATMNPESYAATFKLDEALLDRFYAVVPVPDLQKGTTSETFKKVIRMNMKAQSMNRNETNKLIKKIRTTYRTLHGNKDIVNAVSEYVSNYMEILISKTDSYISPRKTIHLVEEIMGLGSYYKHCGQMNYLSQGAHTALTYVLGIPFKIKPELLMQIHANLKQLLLKKTIDDCARIKLELAKVSGNGALTKYVKKNIERIKRFLPYDETEKLLAQIVDKSDDKNLPVLRDILNRVNGHEEQKKAIKARILFYEIKAVDRIQQRFAQYTIRNDMDFELFDRIKSFSHRLKRLPLDKKIERLIFKNEIDDKEILKFIGKGGFDADKTETHSGVQGSRIKPARNIRIRPG
jgi:MoxR-like ATPase